MSDFLHNLRNKSSSVRERIAMGTTVMITVVIVAIWLSTNRVLTFANPETATVQVIDAPGPFDAVKNSFSQFSDNFSKNVDDLKMKFNTEEVAQQSTIGN